jgi:GNAT superfamily N-acetyltransferase
MENIFPSLVSPRASEPRDLANFIRIRPALPSDDLGLAELLIHTFSSTYERKLPSVITTKERKQELRDVSSRRKHGYVGVAELGYRIIGTFSLIHPESPRSEAWNPNGATLRCVAIDPEFHGLRLSELLLQGADRVASAWNSAGLYLHVQKGADKVAKLYLRHGYQRDPNGDKLSFGCELEGYLKCLETKKNECQ